MTAQEILDYIKLRTEDARHWWEATIELKLDENTRKKARIEWETLARLCNNLDIPT